MEHHWDFQTIIDNWPVLWVGVKGTVFIFVVTVVLGLGGGLIIGMGRYARSRVFRWPATAFVEVFRNTPVLVQIIWFYYAFPILTGIEVDPRGRARHLAQYHGVLRRDLPGRHPVDRTWSVGGR